MGTFRVSPDEYLARFSVSPEDYLAGVRKPKAEEQAAPVAPVKAPSSYQIQADDPTPAPVGPPLISTRRVLRRVPNQPVSANPTVAQKATDLVEGVPVVGPLAAAVPKLFGVQPAAPIATEQYEGEKGRRVEIGADWRPTGEAGQAADDLRSVRDNLLRQPFGLTETIQKAEVPWYLGGDAAKGAATAAAGLVDSPESILSLSGVPAAFAALKGGGLVPRAVAATTEAGFATDAIQNAARESQDPNKSFLEKAGNIGTQALFAAGMLTGAGRTMRPEAAAITGAAEGVARQNLAKREGLPFAVEPSEQLAAATRAREADPQMRMADRIANMPDTDLAFTHAEESNLFAKGLMSREIQARRASGRWNPESMGPTPEPMNREARRAEVAPPETGAPEPVETAAAPVDPRKQQVAAQLGLGDYTQLSPADREVIDSLTREPEPAPTPPLRVSPEQYIARQLGFGAVENLQPWQHEVLRAELDRRTAPPEVPNPTEGGAPLASEPTQPAGKGVIQSSSPEGPAGASVGPEGAEPKYKFGSTQINLPPDVAEPIRQAGLSIPDEHLAADGRETEPHVTVKYGLKDTSPEAIEKLRETLSQQPPVEVGFGKTSVFPNGKSNNGDVVKVDVDSPALHELNALVKKAIPTEDTHPTYQPHATIAYVKPGLGKQYEGNEFLAGKKTVVDRVLVSDRDGNKVEIPLGGQKGIGRTRPQISIEPEAKEGVPSPVEQVSSENTSQSGTERAIREVAPVPEPPRSSNQGRIGAPARIIVPGENRSVQARYAVRELDDVHASHNPFSFEKNPKYQHVNDRDYRSPQNAERIVRQAKGFEPDLLINTNPDATNGPPIIDSAGNVLGGNSRTMTLGRVYADHPESAARYKETLRAQAAQYGLKPEDVDAMQRPVLVREAVQKLRPQDVITDLNKTGTANLLPGERAISDAKRIGDSTIEFLSQQLDSEGPEASLAEVLSSKRGPQIVNRLIEDQIITAQERNSYVDKNENLTAEGKQRIQRMLVGRMFRDTAQYDNAAPELRNKLERAVAPLTRLQARPEWDLTEMTREAIDALTDAKTRDIKNLQDLVSQQDMFGNVPQYSPEAIAIAEKLKQGPLKVAAAYRQYAADEILSRPGQPGTMFEPPTREQAFESAFGPVEAAANTPSGFDRLAAEASSRLSSAFQGTTLSANPVGMIGDLAIVGAHKLARGVTKFGDWTKEMIRDYGDQIKPHLWQIWAESKKWMAERMPERRGASPARLATQRGALSIPPLSPDIPPRGPVAVPGRLAEVPKPERLQVSPHADESWSNLIDKSGLSEESKLGLIDTIDKYMKANPERRVVTDAEYKEMAAKVDPLTVWQIDPKKLNRGNLPPREVMEAAVGMKDALQSEIERKTVELAKMPADAPADAVQKANGELESLIRDQQKLLDIIFPVRSEHGRNLRMWGVEAMANLDPVYWIARARRAAGLKPNVALPGDLEPRLLKVIAETKAAEDEAAGNTTGSRKPKPSTPKPGPRTIPEQTPEQRMETLRRRELARLNGELNGKRLVNGMTAEERQALASDPEIADLRQKVHDKRIADKPIKTDDQVIADEIERERRRLSRILEDEPTTARVDRLTPEQRAAVDRDAGIQSLRDRLRQKQLAQRDAARVARQNIPESHVIEKGVGREIDRAEKMGDQITNPTAPTPKAQMTPEQLAAINSDPRVLAARRKLVNLMNEVQKDGLLASISAMRRAGLLTAPKTWLRNIGGNTAFQFAEETARIPSAVADAAMGIFTGQRTVQGADPVAFAKAGYQAATRGMKEAGDVMKHGLTEDQLRQFDFRKELNSGSKVLDAYVNTVMRFMSAQDRIYKVFAYDRSLAEQMNLAKVDTPTEAMRTQAIADADFATFNNRNQVATGFSKFRSHQNAAVKFGIDLIVPFSQTPSNVVLRALDYTPVGAAFRIGGALKKAYESHGMTPEAQRQISQAIGRGATGSALIYLGYWMAKNNMMTGNRPDNPGEVRADQAARRQWGSIKVGDTWYQVNAFSPIGNLLTTGAALWEGSHAAVKGSEAEQMMKRTGYTAGAAVKTVTDMPMMQGVDLLEKVKQSPVTTAMSAAGNIAGSFVPTAVADVGSALDPYQRDRGTGADSFTGQIKARVPVLRETLPIKRDAFGEPMEQNRFAGVDPTLHQQSREDTDPVAKEIATEQVRLGATKKLPGESEALYQFRLRIRGAALRQKMDEAINNGQYENLPGLKEGSEARRDALAGASHKATAMVNRILTPRYSKLDEEEKAARLQRAAELLNVQ